MVDEGGPAVVVGVSPHPPNSSRRDDGDDNGMFFVEILTAANCHCLEVVEENFTFSCAA